MDRSVGIFPVMDEAALLSSHAWPVLSIRRAALQTMATNGK